MPRDNPSSEPATVSFVQSLSPSQKVLVAVGLYLGWTALTWVFEGRIRTLLRPEAVVDRLVYTLFVNVLVGTALVLVLVAAFLRGEFLTRADLGFRSARRTLAWVVLAGALGAVLFVVQGSPTSDPVVLLNVFAQVLPTSIAEILVCWVAVGGSLAAFLRGRDVGEWLASGAALAASSVLFGVYHVAHSPPFNTVQMVALLTVVGVGTGAIYFAGGTLYGALVYHNFMASFGVLTSLGVTGQLQTYQRLQVPLLVIALVALAVLVAGDRLLVRNVGGATEGETG